MNSNTPSETTGAAATETTVMTRDLVKPMDVVLCTKQLKAKNRDTFANAN